MGFRRVKSDLRSHCAIVQPLLYDSAVVTQITHRGAIIIIYWHHDAGNDPELAVSRCERPHRERDRRGRAGRCEWGFFRSSESDAEHPTWPARGP